MGWGESGEWRTPESEPPPAPHPCQVRTNVPSWCDRILWKSYPETHVNCNAYGEQCDHPQYPRLFSGDSPPSILTASPSTLAAGCTDDIVTSDHSPVFGSFEVGVTSQFVSKKGAYAQGGYLAVPCPSMVQPLPLNEEVPGGFQCLASPWRALQVLRAGIHRV